MHFHFAVSAMLPTSCTRQIDVQLYELAHVAVHVGQKTWPFYLRKEGAPVSDTSLYQRPYPDRTPTAGTVVGCTVSGSAGTR